MLYLFNHYPSTWANYERAFLRNIGQMIFYRKQVLPLCLQVRKDFDKKLNSNNEMRENLSHMDTVAPLTPREAFLADKRTHLTYTHKRTKNTYRILRRDLALFIRQQNTISSCRNDTEHFKSINNYEEITKCTVLPPRNIFILILPTRING